MFDFVRNQKIVIQIILALIIIPFALFGLESYTRVFSGSDDVAEVAGAKISRNELNRSLQEQQDRMRQLLGGRYDPTLFDTPQTRAAVLDNLIQQRLLGNYIARNSLTVGDESLQQAIAGIDVFQENGKFSRERYQETLKRQGHSPVSFQESYRMDLTMQRLNAALVDTGITAKTLTKSSVDLLGEQREIAEFIFSPQPYAGRVVLDGDAVEKYYKANQKEFEIPEQVRAEYVVLNQEMVGAQTPIKPEDVRGYYDKNYGAKFAERTAARKKAEDLVRQAREAGDRFAALAKEYSQDPGSKDNGGDLGFFGRGAMVKPFEDAVFRLRAKEVSNVVETEFGFHIIRLEEIRPNEKGEERRASHILVSAPPQVKDFEAMRTEIEREMRRQNGQAGFSKAATEFTDLADQQQESLKPFADRFKLAPQTSGWLTRGGANGEGAVGNPKTIEALFDKKAIETKQTTLAIEAAPGVLVVARVLEHKPAAQRPLDEVRGQISKMLTTREAVALARKAGEEKLAALKKGDDSGVKWAPAKLVSRDNPQGLSSDALRAVFRADPSKFPAYAGAEAGDRGYVIYRVTKTVAGSQDAAKAGAAEAQIARSSGFDEFKAFTDGLRARGKVEINQANLERAPR